MFTIFSTQNLNKRVLANVEDMAAAERYLAQIGEVIAFDLDDQNDGCADAAVLVGLFDLRIYAIEAAK